MHGGTCIDGLYNYTCDCAHMYNGTNCENDLSLYGCNVTACLNGGTCITVTGAASGEKNYRCDCVNGRFNILIFSICGSGGGDRGSGPP